MSSAYCQHDVVLGLYCEKCGPRTLDFAVVQDEMDKLRRVAEIAKRFVPDPRTIQWEKREIELRDALAELNR